MARHYEIDVLVEGELHVSPVQFINELVRE